MDMSDPALLQSKLNYCHLERIPSHLEQQWPVRERVSRALGEANAAFAAQCTRPDGYTFMQTCDDLTRFLDLGIPLEHTEQRLVVQALQIACAMHENAVSNPSLTPTQRSFHYLATVSLVSLCMSALETAVMDTDIWCETLNLTCRAEQARAKAMDELDLSKYFDTQDNQSTSSESENGAGRESAMPSPTLRTSKPANTRVSVRDTATGAHPTPPLPNLREKALDLLDRQPCKTAPLGRCHTMPTLSSTAPSPYPSGTTASRASSQTHSRGHGLYALEEVGE